MRNAFDIDDHMTVGEAREHTGKFSQPVNSGRYRKFHCFAGEPLEMTWLCQGAINPWRRNFEMLIRHVRRDKHILNQIGRFGAIIHSDPVNAAATIRAIDENPVQLTRSHVLRLNELVPIGRQDFSDQCVCLRRHQKKMGLSPFP